MSRTVSNRRGCRTVKSRRLFLERLEYRTLLATITVNTVADDLSDDDGTVSLREAITAINAGNDLGDPDITAQNPGTFGTNDTINFNISGAAPHVITLGSALPTITDSVTINGGGAATTIVDANHIGRVFDISGSSIVVNMSGLTIRNGTSTNADGGGIHLRNATLNLSNSTVTGNAAPNGDGGGIYNDEGTLALTSVTLSNNSANNGDGGGIYNNVGTVTLTLVTISGGSASNGDGGGIYNFEGELSVTDSTVAGNTLAVDGSSGDGGGIYNTEDGTVTLTRTTVSGNSAGSSGDGGGIYSDSGPLTIINSTLSGNSASEGGGIYFEGGTLRLFSSTIAFNTSSTGEGGGVQEFGDDSAATSTIIAENTGGDCGSNGITNTSNHNLDSDGSCFFVSGNAGGTGNKTANPLLGPLANNGGPTQTHALLAGSPAIDAGDDSVLGAPLSLTTDQRGTGFPRLIGSHVDIGAFEGGTAAPSGGLPVCNIATLNGPGAPGTAILQADADNPGHTVLLVTGTSLNDTIVIEPRPLAPSQIRVKINGVVVRIVQSSAVQRIVGYGLAGSDTIVVNATLLQPATLFGGDGNDALFGARGNDQLAGGAGNDSLFGLGGNDALCGDDGNDFLYGGDGKDILFGEAGSDHLYGEAGDDQLLGGDGNDFLFGGLGNDQLFGQAGADQLFGEVGNDILVGGGGNDQLYGGTGRNLMIGGDGADQLVGNAGDDILVAGSTIHDENQVALAAIYAEWTSNHSYATRVSNLRSGGGANGAFRLNGTTVIDDHLVDVIVGDGGLDWFFVGAGDKIKDKAKNELLN